jgi:aminoglycoside phosphotransferase (APT) family kinase protein
VRIDDSTEVAAGVTQWVRANVHGASNASFDSPLEAPSAGMSTFIWFGRLDGLETNSSPWSDPLALRMFPSSNDAEAAAREAAILEFVAARGYPVPRPLATVTDPNESAFATPWLVLPRVPGRPMLDAITANPFGARRLLHDLADLQLALHQIEITSCPIPYPTGLIDQWFARYEPQIARIADIRADRVLAAMRSGRRLVNDEVPVICHGDFHPLNVMSHRAREGWVHAVIDWTDTMIGDRHYDVSRTIALFGLATLAVSNPIERMAAAALGPVAARYYKRAYHNHAPLDQRRLDFWTIAHLIRGWAQVRELADPADPADIRTSAATQVPATIADTMLRRAERLVAELSIS